MRCDVANEITRKRKEGRDIGDEAPNFFIALGSEGEVWGWKLRLTMSNG